MTWSIERDYRGDNARVFYGCERCEHRIYFDEKIAMDAIKGAIPDAAPWQAHAVVLEQNKWFTSPKGQHYCPRCVTVATITPIEAPADLPAIPMTRPPDSGREIDLE